MTHFRLAATFEGLTLLVLLLVAVPLKHFYGYRDWVSILGPLHGFAFLFYQYHLWTLFQSGTWDKKTTCKLALCALLPGGFLYSVRLTA